MRYNPASLLVPLILAVTASTPISAESPSTASPLPGAESVSTKCPPAHVLHASDSDRRIYEALNKPVRFEERFISLADLAAHLRAELHVPVEVDEAALAAIGFAADVPALSTVSHKKLRTALVSMLNPQLAYSVRYGRLVLTTKTAAAARGHWRTYRVDDLAYHGNVAGLQFPDFESLVDRIEEACGAGSWSSQGSQIGEIHPLEGPGIAVLVVRQLPDVHLQIESLLDLMRAARVGERRVADATADATRPATVEDSFPKPVRLLPAKTFGGSDDEARVRRKLEEPCRLPAGEYTVADLAEVVGRRHSVAVSVNQAALGENGIFDNVVVRPTLVDGSLGDVLSAALEREGLTAVVRRERLEITTPRITDMGSVEPDAERVRVYPVQDLVLAYHRQGELRPDFDALTAVLCAIGSRSYFDAGVEYSGTIRPFERPAIWSLVLTQTEPAYRDIDRALAMLRAAYVSDLHAAQIRRRQMMSP